VGLQECTAGFSPFFRIEAGFSLLLRIESAVSLHVDMVVPLAIVVIVSVWSRDLVVGKEDITIGGVNFVF
jgi:hypothetical protein